VLTGAANERGRGWQSSRALPLFPTDPLGSIAWSARSCTHLWFRTLRSRWASRAWLGLLLGRDDQDPLFLQIKEAQASVLEEAAGPSGYRNAGERVVAGQRAMQVVSDIFQGWTTVKRQEGDTTRTVDYYIRQFRDWKGSVEPTAMIPQGLALYGRVCGATLARAHARTGDRVAIGAYLGSGATFDTALLGFAEAYADQNDRDYAALIDAIASGRLEAATGI
jgi:hypothetical protein